MYLKIRTDLLLNFLFNLLKIDISSLMFCTDCKYYLIIWLFKVNSDDEKTRLDQMNQIVWLLLGMKSEINLSFVYIWQSKLDQSALISECLSNSIPYNFQVSNSVENDGSMMKKKYCRFDISLVLLVWQVNMKLFGNFVSLSNQKKKQTKTESLIFGKTFYLWSQRNVACY